MANPRSITGKYLSGELPCRCPPSAATQRKESKLKVSARAATTSRTSRRTSRSAFTCVTGVSGGGKSTFLIDTLYKAAARG
jgi:excinuclease ABC subunit A